MSGNLMGKAQRPLDERIASLPVWAREHIAALGQSVRRAEAETKEVRAQFTDGLVATDTMLEGVGGGVPDRPLGNGARVEFQGSWTVTAGLAAAGVPAALCVRPAILVEGIADLEIVPVERDRILIRSAR